MFDFDVSERQKLQQHIRDVSTAESGAWQVREPKDLSDWPGYLVGAPDVEKSGVLAYTCSDVASDHRLFINWREGRGFVWSSGR